MSAARKIEAPEPFKHILSCEEDGCSTQIITEEKAAHIAKNRCLAQAREDGWALWKREDAWHGRCPACEAKRVRGDSERKIILRAQNAKAEQKRIREAKKEVDARRATKPVGKDIAGADSTLTKETPKLIHRNNFERYVYGKLESGQRRAADHLASLIEAASGVSDKELYQEKTDGGTGNFEPSAHQMDALKNLREARQGVGAHLFDVADHAIIQDAVPARVGARYGWLTNDRDRAMVGMVMIRVALNALATHWRMG